MTKHKQRSKQSWGAQREARFEFGDFVYRYAVMIRFCQ